MTRRAARPGEHAVWDVANPNPIIDECACKKLSMSYVPNDDQPQPPQIDAEGIKHFFDGSLCRSATREEWRKVSTYPYPFA